jgi:endonuclease III-like uncharacterized protein
MGAASAEDKVLSIYSTLAAGSGLQHWSLANASFEVVVGAYPTENTSWRNVERVIARLYSERVLALGETADSSRRTRRPDPFVGISSVKKASG